MPSLTFGTATIHGGVKAGFELANGSMVTPTSHGQLTLDTGASTLVLYKPSNVRWTGEGGRTIFFQNELPYDAPNQAAWLMT